MSTPIGFLFEVTGKHIITGALRVFRFANFRFTTTGSDTPPNEPYALGLKQPLNATRSVFLPGTTSGRSAVQKTNVVIENKDRARDDMRRYSFGGRPAVQRIGPTSGTLLSDFQAFSYVASQPDIGDEISFALLDAKAPLDATLQGNKFAGTGDLEGTADLTGKPKPITLGTVFNIAPPRVHVTKEIYQANDGPILSAFDVANQGALLSFGGTYASEADLLNDALQPPFGCYKVWPAGGYVRINTAGQAQQVTMSITQGTTAADRTAAQLMRRLWLRAGVDAGDILTSDLDALDAKQPAELGLYLGTEDVKAADVCDQIAISIGAGWGSRNADGKLRFVRIEIPAGDVAATFTQYNAPQDSPLKQESTSDKERGKPAKRVTVQFATNYTVQDASSLVDSVSQERREFLKVATRTATAFDAAVEDTYDDAIEVTVPSLFVYAADAQAEADRVLALRKVFRFRFTLTVVDDDPAFAALDLFDIVGLNYDRYVNVRGLNAGVRFLLIGVAPNAQTRKRVLTLWGNSLSQQNLGTESGALFRTEDGKFLVTDSH